VLIVTFYKALNAGAFLQAFALQEILKSRGLDPQFLNIYSTSQLLLRYKIFLSRKSLTVGGIQFNLRKLRAFSKAQERLNTRNEHANYRAAFLGSDEIWNVTNKSFRPIGKLFGKDIPTQHVFSYAA